jgi:hypothetical protein
MKEVEPETSSMKCEMKSRGLALGQIKGCCSMFMFFSRFQSRAKDKNDWEGKKRAEPVASSSSGPVVALAD